MPSKLVDWNEFKLFFDADGNNTIDKAEFVSGFIKWLAVQQIHLPQTHESSLDSVVDLISVRADETVCVLADSVQQKFHS